MEKLLEGLQGCIDDMESLRQHGVNIDSAILSNLKMYCDRLYVAWESTVSEELLSEILKANAQMKALLRERMSHQEIVDLRLTTGIDIEYD